MVYISRGKSAILFTWSLDAHSNETYPVYNPHTRIQQQQNALFIEIRITHSICIKHLKMERCMTVNHGHLHDFWRYFLVSSPQSNFCKFRPRCNLHSHILIVCVSVRYMLCVWNSIQSLIDPFTNPDGYSSGDTRRSSGWGGSSGGGGGGGGGSDGR